MEISDLQVKQFFIFSLEGVGRARHLIFQVEKKISCVLCIIYQFYNSKAGHVTRACIGVCAMFNFLSSLWRNVADNMFTFYIAIYICIVFIVKTIKIYRLNLCPQHTYFYWRPFQHSEMLGYSISHTYLCANIFSDCRGSIFNHCYAIWCVYHSMQHMAIVCWFHDDALIYSKCRHCCICHCVWL